MIGLTKALSAELIGTFALIIAFDDLKRQTSGVTLTEVALP